MKRIIVIFIMAFLLLSSIVQASEVFLLLVTDKGGKVYRMKTDNPVRRPLGYFFVCDDTEAFYIDNFKDFRMLNCNPNDSFFKCDNSIFRQINDSEIKSKMNLIHNDQRELVKNGSLAMPVFCPENYPFSAGLGVPVKPEIALTSIYKTAFAIKENKQWYRIPNGSWYRSWFKAKNNEDGYLIYNDEWRDRPLKLVESFWRGELPGKAVEREVLQLSSKSLFRSVVSENLEILPQYSSEFIVASVQDKFSSFFKSGKSFDKGELLLYSYKGNKPGQFEIVGGDNNKYVKGFESLSKKKRFAAIGHRKLFAIGSDILKNWLYETGIDNKKAECTLACFKEEPKGNSIFVAVYSEPESTIFRFRYNENLNVLSPNVNRIELDLKPEAMCFDKDGNLLIAATEKDEVKFFKNVEPGYEVETTYFDSKESLGEFSEEHNSYVKVNIPEALDGAFIFSQGYHNNLYLIDKNSSKLRLLHSINLNKNYFCREFTIYNASENILTMNYDELMKAVKKPGNYLSELKTEVPDFPDQFKKPEKVFIATF